MNKMQKCPKCGTVHKVAGLGGHRPANKDGLAVGPDGAELAWFCACHVCGGRFQPTHEGAGPDHPDEDYATIRLDQPGQFRVGYWPAPGEIKQAAEAQDALERLGGSDHSEH